MSQPIELAADYYLSNFHKLTEHALEWYPDLLTDSELRWLHGFEQLSRDAQCLLVRLLSRKGQWFRSDKLRYEEISDIDSALDLLNESGFISLDPVISEKQLALHLLTKGETQQLFGISNKNLRKEQMVDEVSDNCFTLFSQLPYRLIELRQPNVIDVLLTLFFANTHQDLSQFVLDDLGLHQFEQYQLSKARRFFSDRQQVEQLLQLSQIQSEYVQSDRKQSHNLISLLEQLPDVVSHPYIERKRQHLINDLARDLERLGLLTECLEWFSKTELPPSRERQARVFDKLDNITAMSDVVTKMLTQPYDISELEVAEKLAQRVKRKLGQRVPRTTKPKVSEYHLQLDLSQHRVELAVQHHFEQLGYRVFYAENSVLNGLFGLAFWHTIFSPVEGAFINQYQHRPLDLYHSDFMTKRQSDIDTILADIANNGLSHLKQVYQQKFGISNPFVHWQGFTLPLLESCIESIPNHLVVDLFKVMLSDLKIYRNGMPDLILFKDGEFEWVEVKGPGDKLQDNQWRWISHFKRLKVPFSVAYVIAT